MVLNILIWHDKHKVLQGMNLCDLIWSLARHNPAHLMAFWQLALTS